MRIETTYHSGRGDRVEVCRCKGKSAWIEAASTALSATKHSVSIWVDKEKAAEIIRELQAFIDDPDTD